MFTEIELMINQIIKEMAKLHLCFCLPVFYPSSPDPIKIKYKWRNDEARDLYEKWGEHVKYLTAKKWKAYHTAMIGGRNG
ncbi:hypothetical protein LCGC14_0826780 [marine sediment metagenome]|uniref:Uncharacterized protein n=1 Tax=marine sediment metagenome TaxID=412755 RepID=A0A0F9PLW6_9ZZZZ